MGISAASSPRKAAPREGTPKAVEPPQHSSTPLEKAQEYVNGLEPTERMADPAASIGDEEERPGEGERVEEEHVGEVRPIRIGDEGSEEEEEEEEEEDEENPDLEEDEKEEVKRNNEKLRENKERRKRMKEEIEEKKKVAEKMEAEKEERKKKEEEKKKK